MWFRSSSFSPCYRFLNAFCVFVSLNRFWQSRAYIYIYTYIYKIVFSVSFPYFMFKSVMVVVSIFIFSLLQILECILYFCFVESFRTESCVYIYSFWCFISLFMFNFLILFYNAIGGSGVCCLSFFFFFLLQIIEWI